MKLINNELKVGQEVWICDYRFNNILEKPIRNIKPQKVKVVSNKDLPKNKTIYYSETHFRPINNKNKILSKIISPYDNTGYRMCPGECVKIFDNEEECFKEYKKQCKVILENIELERKRFNLKLDNLKIKILK